MDVLHPFQERAIQRLCPGRTALFLRYGAGKSWIALEYVRQFINQNPVNDPYITAIIFCRNHNKLTWQIELSKRYPNARILIAPQDIVGNRRVPTTEDKDGVFILVPHHLIRTLLPTLSWYVTTYNIHALIMDESTAIKNPKAQITTAALKVSKFAGQNCQRLILTGRAMPEGPHEIWSQFEFLYPGKNPLGHSYYDFLRRWFIKTDYGWVLELAQTDVFYAIIRNHSVWLTDQDLVELKEHIGVTREQFIIEHYEESTEQRKILNHLYANWALPTAYISYDGLKTEMEFDLPFDDRSIVDTTPSEEYLYALSVQMKAQQISGGFYYTSNGRSAVTLRQQPKLGLLVEILHQLLEEKHGRKIIVWHRFDYERVLIIQALVTAKIVAVIGPDARMLLEFNRPSGASVILMPVQISQGFNELVVADTNIFYSNVYSSELREQAEARLKRIGQKHHVITHIDLASARQVDIEIVTALQSKAFNLERLHNTLQRYRKQPQPEKTC